MGKLPWYKRWIRRILFDICWNLGDTLLGWSLKFADGPTKVIVFNPPLEIEVQDYKEGEK